MDCWPCRRGQHGGCISMYTDTPCDCDHTTGSTLTAPLSEIGAAISAADTLAGLSESEDSTPATFRRRLKDDSAVTDIQSTGRKRAAILYPLKDDNGRPLPCDFQGKSNCLPNYMAVQIDGCGVRPGTLPGIAQARHHHDYNVLNNERENVGLLCHNCHNQLHAKNDPHKDKIYETIYGFKPTKEDLSHAAKALKSGIVGGGHIDSQGTNTSG